MDEPGIILPTDPKPRRRFSVEAKAWFYQEIKKGRNPYTVADQLGASRATARKWMKQMNAAYGEASPKVTAARIAADSSVDGGYPDPIRDPRDLNHAQAKQAWEEFGYFRNLLLGRRHIAWQVEMCHILMSWWESGQKVKDTESSEVIKGIVNAPPGGGKSTTITHDFPGWLITRNRDIRIALGARTSAQSGRYVRRLRNTLEKNVLLNTFYGRFKPLQPEEWRTDAFIVDGVLGHEATIEYRLSLGGFDPNSEEVKQRLADPNDSIHEILEAIEVAFLTGEKESTVAALSQEMGFLGGRFDMNLWDDLCDKNDSKTADQRESLSEWWFAEAESRCEPGGLVALVGTRFGKFDLYRHCREMTYQTEDDVDEALLDEVTSAYTEAELQQVREDLEKELVDKHGANYSELATPSVEKGMRRSRRIYRYFKFPAHDETTCENPTSLKNTDHVKCILDPKRFSWRHLAKVSAQNPGKFRLTYQQEDESTSENLVQKIWLTGGVDESNVHYPGCYDYGRKLQQIPDDLDPANCFSIATLDPSAQNWWSVQWWIYDTVSDQDYLIDLVRSRLTAGGFLDYDIKKRQFAGVAQDWQMRSKHMDWPISLWIIEQNAAQRYLFQHRWVNEWMKSHSTTIKGHQTHNNRADPELGVEASLPGRFRLGKVNLPFDQDHLYTRVTVNEFARELIEYPDGQTDDMVMGYWFFDFNRLLLPDSMRVSRANNPVKHIYRDEFPGYLSDEPTAVQDKAGKLGNRAVTPVRQGHVAAQRQRRREADLR